MNEYKLDEIIKEFEKKFLNPIQMKLYDEIMREMYEQKHVFSNQEILDLSDRKLIIKKLSTIKDESGKIIERIGLVNSKTMETVRDFLIKREDNSDEKEKR